MKTRRGQTGMSIPGMLVVAVMVGFFVMCIIRMWQPYFEYLSVRNIIQNISSEHGAADLRVTDIRRSIAKNFNTNQIYELNPREVEVYRREGKTYIDARYEVRIPIMGRIDAILNFDDLVYIAGSAIPVQGDPPKPEYDD